MRNKSKSINLSEKIDNFKNFDFNKTRPVKTKYRMANSLISYYGWIAYPTENRISKQSKINNQ